MQTDLLSRERQDAIRKRLQQSGRVLAGELARAFQVSEDTIRRDLRDMAAAGLCERVYGGALALPADRPFAVRSGEAVERKQALSRAAVACLTSGMTVFVDAGSTNLAIVEALPAGLELTLVTNMPAIAVAAMAHSAIAVVTVGGRLDRHVGATIGARAERDIEALRPDLTILGTCGLDLVAGLTAVVYEDAEFKRAVASRSAAIVAAVTTDKIGRALPHGVMRPDARTTLVLEADAPDEIRHGFADAGATILTAEPVSHARRRAG